MFFKKSNQEKMFRALVNNQDTIYLMYQPKEEKVIYTTKNIKDVLGFDVDYKRDTEKVVKEILNLPILKEELSTWDRRKEFVSSMISYRNTSYQHTRWIKVKIYPVREKKKLFYVIQIADATKEHDRQHIIVSQASDLKIREQKLNQITAISYDVEMTITLSNGNFDMKNLKEVNNYFGSEVKGYYKDILKDITSYLEDVEQEKFILKIEEVIQEKKEEPTYIRYRLNDKKTTLESVIFYIKSKVGDTVTILTHDVTEDMEYVKRQNQTLQKALEDLENASNAKNEFISIVSHEIRSPMNVIIGLSESVLGKENLDKSIYEDIDAINTASCNLLEVIDGLLDISKIESNTLSLKEKEYDLASLLRELDKYTKGKMKDKKIELELAIDPNLPSIFYGDVTKIRQVLQSILSNAAKFTEKGTIVLKVNWVGKEDTGKIKFSVSDTGCGISKSKLNHLFDDKQSQSMKSGMGLYIAKKYIDLLSGKIEVESEVKKGSTFTVTISQKVKSEKKLGDIYAKRKRKTIDYFDASSYKLLVVDDDKLNLKVAERLLKPYNMELEFVTSGKEALKLLENNTYDLILLDQMMPELSGTDTLKQMKELNIKIPTVMLTADAMVGKKELYLKAGFDDYLSKPINTDELHQILLKYLQK